VGRGSSPGHVLHPFLLALHTNLAADVAKLGMPQEGHKLVASWIVTGRGYLINRGSTPMSAALVGERRC
jgi:hypothetical protein